VLLAEDLNFHFAKLGRHAVQHSLLVGLTILPFSDERERERSDQPRSVTLLACCDVVGGEDGERYRAALAVE
jgi:hypothetical protein